MTPDKRPKFGPEDFLTLELVAALAAPGLMQALICAKCGAPRLSTRPSCAVCDSTPAIPSEKWREHRGAARTLEPGFQGSCNWPILAEAVAMLRGEGDEADLLRFCELSRGAWMGIEAGSRIYFTMHFLGVAAAAIYASGKLRRALLGWLAWALYFLDELEAPDGTLLLVGQRSAAHVARGLLEWVKAKATGGDVGRAERWCKESHDGLRDDWEFLAMTPALEAVLREAAAELEAEPHAILSPYHVARGEAYLAVWTERNLNPNTPPVLGAIYERAAVRWIPAGGGLHVREKFDRAAIVLEGDELRYTSSLHPGQVEILRAGVTVRILGLPPGGGELEIPSTPVDPPPAPAPDPAPPPPAPGKPPRRERWFEFL